MLKDPAAELLAKHNLDGVLPPQRPLLSFAVPQSTRRHVCPKRVRNLVVLDDGEAQVGVRAVKGRRRVEARLDGAVARATVPRVDRAFGGGSNGGWNHDRRAGEEGREGRDREGVASGIDVLDREGSERLREREEAESHEELVPRDSRSVLDYEADDLRWSEGK